MGINNKSPKRRKKLKSELEIKITENLIPISREKF